MGAGDTFLRDTVVGAWSCSPLSCVEFRYSWSYATTLSHAIMGQIYMYFTTLVAVSRSWTKSVVHHYICHGRASFLLSISLLQKLFVTDQDHLFLSRQSVVFSYRCDRWQHKQVRQYRALKSLYSNVSCFDTSCVEWGMFLLYKVDPFSVTNGWFSELSVSSGVGSDLSIVCLTTLSISEVYIASNKPMSKEWCGKWCTWICKKNGSLSL